MSRHPPWRRRSPSAHHRRGDSARAAVAGALLTGAVAAASLTTVARAQDRAPPAEAHLRYLIEKANCEEGPADRDREACLRDAAAAYAEARKGTLESGEDSFEPNALQRCDALRADDREDCVARIRGQGTTSGSVEGGGLYREFRTREIGPAER